MDARIIGRRIALWRQRRRLTQSDHGALTGKTKRWVQFLESGERQADPRISVLEVSADALRIPMEWLLRDGPETACMDAVELETIRTVLQGHDVITGYADSDSGDPLDVDTLRGRVTHGWNAFQTGAIGSLGRLTSSQRINMLF